MPNSQFHTAISLPRFSKYLTACKGDKRKALQLYRLNIMLSQRMYAVIGIFEIILRNSIDRHYSQKIGTNWLTDAAQPGGYLNMTDCRNSCHNIMEGIKRLGSGLTNDRLIAELSFGFWTYQFATKEYAAGGSTLLEIFPNRTYGTKQKTVFQNLVKVNGIRNRIAHYEPICFDKLTGHVSTIYTEKRYLLILDLLDWLGCNPKKILYGIDSVPKAIRIIRDMDCVKLISQSLVV